MKERYYLTARDDGTSPYADTEEVDATALAAALCGLRTAWRDENRVFSIRVMQAFGAMIAETEAVIDFDTPEGAHG